MGIRSWFGLERPETPEPAVAAPSGPPTTEQLLGALEAVETQARDGRVPGVVYSRLLRVTGVVRESIPRLERLGIGSTQGYSVMATATDYLPVAIGNYLRLPRDWADTRPIADGKSSVMLLVDQLDLLGATMDKVADAINRSDAEAIIVHGAFLEEKFGHASTGGALGLTPIERAVPPDPAPTPTPTPIERAVPPETAPGPTPIERAVPPGTALGDPGGNALSIDRESHRPLDPPQ